MNLFAFRLRKGDLLKESIERVVAERKFSAVTIVSAVGSLSKLRIRMAGAQPDRQDIREFVEPFEVVSLIGNIGQGRAHVHIAASNKEGQVVGGHLKEGSIVETTAEIVLAVDTNLVFSEETDETTGFGELVITNGESDADSK